MIQQYRKIRFCDYQHIVFGNLGLFFTARKGCREFLVINGAHIRLVYSAFKEPHNLAFLKKGYMKVNFDRQVQEWLLRPLGKIFCGKT